MRVYPFKVLRPEPETVAQVSTRISGSETIDALTEELESNPFSYLHVVKPYLHFADPEHQEQHFPFGRSYFQQLKAQNILVSENNKLSFIYRQTYIEEGSVFEGFLTGISVYDYIQGNVKKHEHTITQKENKLVKHIETLGVIGEPMLLCFDGHKAFDFAALKGDLYFDFISQADGIRHEVWRIDEKGFSAMETFFEDINQLYIADGHHRIAASVRYLENRRNHDLSAEDAIFMAYILPADRVMIKSFHRVVCLDERTDVDFLLNQFKRIYAIEKVDTGVIPNQKGEFGLLIKGKGWFKLQMKEEYRPANYPNLLDVACLESLVFKDILGIEDSKADNRMSFLRGDLPFADLEAYVDKNATLAFTVLPNSFQEIKAVADRGGVMPPKSTWIEPKLRTGMIIQVF